MPRPIDALPPPRLEVTSSAGARLAPPTARRWRPRHPFFGGGAVATTPMAPSATRAGGTVARLLPGLVEHPVTLGLRVGRALPVCTAIALAVVCTLMFESLAS